MLWRDDRLCMVCSVHPNKMIENSANSANNSAKQQPFWPQADITLGRRSFETLFWSAEHQFYNFSGCVEMFVIQFYGQSRVYSDVLDYLNMIFTGVFTIEFLLKLFAFRIKVSFRPVLNLATTTHKLYVLIGRLVVSLTAAHCFNCLNPSTPTVAIWVQLWSILCQTGLSRHL